MRAILMLCFVGLCGLPLASQAATPRAIVFGHECQQVNHQQQAFDCRFEENKTVQVTFTLHKSLADFSEAESYLFNKLELRFLQLDGYQFYRDTPSGKWLCQQWRKRAWYKFGCTLMH